MTNFRKEKIQQLKINNIDFNNNFFKISKNLIDDTLLKSIKNNGLINLPLLFNNKRNNTYQIIFGHNRLQVMKNLGVDSINVILIDKISYEDYLNFILIKNYNGEISSIGKLKILTIGNDFFNCNYEKTNLLTKKTLNIPEVIIKDNLIEKIFTLPENLLNYVDYKEINFKIILKLLKLPELLISNLSNFINENFKVNIFKKIVDILHDLTRDKKLIEKLYQLDWSNLDSNKSREDFLLSELLEIRYPEHSLEMRHVTTIINSFRKNKIEIDFPKFFEDDKIIIKIIMRKNDDIDKIINKVSHIDKILIQKLLEFL